jgi:hypothetical protein
MNELIESGNFIGLPGLELKDIIANGGHHPNLKTKPG